MKIFDASIASEQLAQDYNARATISESLFDRIAQQYEDRTTTARLTCDCQLDVCFDPQTGVCFDHYRAGKTPSPVMIFIHGGYWRALGKEHSGFMAPMLADQGIATIVPDYTLSPAATLGEITRQMRACLAYVWKNHAQLNVDPDRIFLCGSSAGGHLVGTLISGGWHAEFGVPETIVAGAMPVSGLFDLSPIARTFPQEWLALSNADVVALSPLQNLPKTGCPIVTAYAAAESSGFIRQSQAFHRAWGDAGFSSRELMVADRNHFDVVLDLCDPETVLSQAFLSLLA